MMDRKKIEVIVGGVLAVIFVAVLFGSIRQIYSKHSSRRVRADSNAASANKPALQLAQKKDAGIGAEGYVKLAWGRDPFMLEEVIQDAGNTIGGLRLTGITTGRNVRSMAIINNEIVGVGSRIGNFKVIKIDRTKVVVTDGKENYDLKLTL